MTRYRVTEEDLAKRIPGRRTMALKLLMTQETTPADLAQLWSVHPTTAYRLLERLSGAGYAKRQDDTKGFGGIYSITEKGTKKVGYLDGLGSVKKSDQTLADIYPDIRDLGADLFKGPVALMRLVEVSELDFRRAGIDALPTRVTLTEDDLFIEKKFDGWLTSSIGGRLFSRRGKELTEKFPPVVEVLQNYESDFLVGELTYWDRGQQDEGAVTSIGGTADPEEAVSKLEALPGVFKFVAFDIIGHEGQDISKKPFAERRGILEDQVTEEENLMLSPTSDFDDWEKTFSRAIAEGGEGIVVKNRKAPYIWRPLGQPEARPVGTQWKVKRVHSENFVALRPRLSDKEKLMVTIAQFHKGDLIPVQEIDNFSAETEKEMARRIDRKGMTLIEVSYQERFGAPPCKLRNGTFLKFRDDAPIESANLPPECSPKD